jgi:hypothetical protein
MHELTIELHESMFSMVLFPHDKQEERNEWNMKYGNFIFYPKTKKIKFPFAMQKMYLLDLDHVAVLSRRRQIQL